MSITAKELAFAATTHTFTRHFRHLLPVPRWLLRGPFMPGQSAPKDTKLKDRVKFWNIVPGDFVKLRGDTSSTVHEVHKVNKLSNRVILKREINKAGYVPDPRSPLGKSVPYAQCQLLVGKYEYPPEEGSAEPVSKNVFATRMTTSTPYFNRKSGYWIWRRYALNTTPRLPNYDEATHSAVRIDWPTPNTVSKPDPTAYDTKADAVNEVTYKPPPLPAKLLSPAPRISTEQEYITSLTNPEKVSLSASAPIEVYLHKELSNPHSRAKKQARWKASSVRSKVTLKEYIQAEYGNLAGRSLKDARAEAVWKWQNRMAMERKEELRRRWKNRGAEARLERKAKRKARKATKRDEKLRNLVLEEAKNQLLPSSSEATAAT